MVIVEPNGQKYYMDGYHKTNLEIAKREVRNDWDMIFVYDGIEGSGKSVKAMQDAMFCDPSFNKERLTFTPQTFRKGVLAANKYEAIQYDEAYTGLSSRATMSMINRTLVSMLAEIRQRNLFIFVVLPCFFDLDKYVALWRSRALIHVYTHEGFKRGFFAFYNTDRKKDLYLIGKKFYSYAKPGPNFRGRFTNAYVIDEKEYRLLKKGALTKREDERAKKEIEHELETRLFERLVDNETLTHVQKIQILGLARTTYFRRLKQYEDFKEM